MKALFITSLALVTTAAANYKPVPITQNTAAPDFKLMNVDDKELTLADIKGEKATAIIFTTNHCPDAIAAVGRIKTLVKTFKPQGVGFVAINSNSPEGLHLAELAFTTGDDSFESMKDFSKDHEFNLPYLYDGDTQEVAKAYGAISTPHIFIFDADLKLKYNGRIDDGRRSVGLAQKNEARDALTAILAGKEPAVIKTRPTGCTTKWKEKAGNIAKINKQWAEMPVTVETIEPAAIAKLAANKDASEFRLFNIWSTTCGPCVDEFPDLADIYRQYSFHKFEFITISLDKPDKDQEKVTEFLQDQEVGIHRKIKGVLKKENRETNHFIFKGDTEDLAKSLDTKWNGAMPHTLLVGKDGKVLYRHNGRIEPMELKKAIVAEVWRLNNE